jgi:replicative DNA helicase Mcm
MNASDQIRKFKEFLELHYQTLIMENARKELFYLVIDFVELSKFDPGLAEILLEEPKEAIRAAELAAEQFDFPTKVESFKVRFKNLPENQKILVRNIRSKHLGKMLWMEGLVRQKSDVRPQVTSARFDCPSCGNVISVLQTEQKFKEPARCGCGRKGHFKLLSKELIDVQRIVLEESPEDLEGGEQPKRINIFLKDDLVSPLTEKKTNPGSKIRLTGFVTEVPIILRSGGQSIKFDLMVDSNFIEPMVEDYYDIKISKKDEEEIKAIAESPKALITMVNSVAPSIFGYEEIKEAILIQLVGGLRKTRADGVVTRGDMHVLLIGDPGAGKSQILKRVTKIAPKARYVSGKGVSGAGLTAAVVKDEFLGGWSLEAGALPLSNKGFVMIDEMDKMSKEDRSAMHEALEQQSVSISKANIQATLRCETTVLAAANPKFGRFDPYDVLAKQIDLPPALINRFDLIFPIKDMPNKERDAELAHKILALHKSPEKQESEIDTNLLRKYISYARQRLKPTLTEGAIEEIQKYYVSMRSTGSEDSGVQPVPISLRQLEALVRLSEGSAKLRLSEKVTKKDAKRAVNILHYCLTKIGLDPETGKIDIDRISTGITASQRSKISVIKEIINELESKLGKTIDIKEITSKAAEKNVKAEDVEDAIEKLKRSGDIFEPKNGFISKI